MSGRCRWLDQRASPAPRLPTRPTARPQPPPSNGAHASQPTTTATATVAAHDRCPTCKRYIPALETSAARAPSRTIDALYIATEVFNFNSSQSHRAWVELGQVRYVPGGDTPSVTLDSTCVIRGGDGWGDAWLVRCGQADVRVGRWWSELKPPSPARLGPRAALPTRRPAF